MDLFITIGLLVTIYYAVYLILPFFLDCDILLAFKEHWGEPVSSLKGKTVWITGASSGIGEHLAYVLARAGCKLILSARRTTELERVKKTCLKESKHLTDDDVEIYPMDMFDFESHGKAFQHVINKFGKLDILVNNAGRSQRARWENIDIEVDKQMFALNVFSVISLSRLAVKHFLNVGGGGHIVNTSSLAGFAAIPMSATYCGTKHALHGYFKPFYMEHPNGINITMVCPGPIQTNFLAECFTEKSNEKYGVTTDVSTSKITAERCATLMGIAIANKLDEVWITKKVPLVLMYLNYCFPTFARWLVKTLGAKYLLKLRDANASKKN